MRTVKIRLECSSHLYYALWNLLQRTYILPRIQSKNAARIISISATSTKKCLTGIYAKKSHRFWLRIKFNFQNRLAFFFPSSVQLRYLLHFALTWINEIHILGNSILEVESFSRKAASLDKEDFYLPPFSLVGAVAAFCVSSLHITFPFGSGKHLIMKPT